VTYVRSAGVRYEDTLAQHALTEDPGEELHGHSGYFSRPTPGYDTRLFEPGTDHIKPAVRQAILGLLYGFWNQRYVAPRSWSTVWIAGSGISHQWGAERGGVGDLDVLIGVDHSRFLQRNRDFGGIPEVLIDQRFNKEFYADLQPSTTEHSFGAGQDPFEVTFYVNPKATDIRDINPYAAYDLTHDSWTVRPPELPEDWDPLNYFDTQTKELAQRKINEGQHLVESYRRAAGVVGATAPGSPHWVNATTTLKHVTEAAVNHFAEIHGNRHQAFSAGGKGYYDPTNFIWQYGKMTGVIDALRTIKGSHDAARREAHAAMYGDASLSTEEAVLHSSLVATKYGH
jgi:hypothetical protein